MLTSINLSISSACEADCIYCPVDRGARIRQKMMSLDLVKKIVDEVASDAFRRRHCVTAFQVSENGDAFLNKNVISILRYIRKVLPSVNVVMCNSFQRLSPDKSKAIVEEGLVDMFICTMNGSTNTSFEAAKRLDLYIVRDNLRAFLEARRQAVVKQTRLVITVLTARRYIAAVQRTFGALPGKLATSVAPKIRDDYAAVRNEWEPLLDPEQDSLFGCDAHGWAERKLAGAKSIDYGRCTCPLLTRVRQEAFIAPDGTWYACCFDSNNELVLGNVSTRSLAELYECDSRIELIDRLERRQFAEIGGPCATVNACQMLDPGFELRTTVKTLLGPALAKRVGGVVRAARRRWWMGAPEQ